MIGLDRAIRICRCSAVRTTPAALASCSTM
jgi:hypothetical protein